MTRVLQSGWFAMTSGGVAFLITMALLLQPALKVSRAISEAMQHTPSGLNFRNPEIDQLMTELRQRREALDRREAQLKELQTRLDAERAEINQVTQTVHELQREFDRSVVRVREDETNNLKKLAKMYSGMTPEGAMTILKELDDTVLVKVLVFMKETDAAQILENLARQGDTAAKRAALISERLRMASAANKNTP